MKNTKRYLVKNLWFLLGGEKRSRMCRSDPNLEKRIFNWAPVLVAKNGIVQLTNSWKQVELLPMRQGKEPLISGKGNCIAILNMQCIYLDARHVESSMWGALSQNSEKGLTTISRNSKNIFKENRWKTSIQVRTSHKQDVLNISVHKTIMEWTTGPSTSLTRLTP